MHSDTRVSRDKPMGGPPAQEKRSNREMRKQIVKKMISVIAAASLVVTGGLAQADLSSAEAAGTVKVTVRSQSSGTFLHAFDQEIEVSADLAESYGYTDKVTDGVSALDAMVAAHELTFGSDFTKDTKDDYLAVGDTGFVTTLFGETTYASGFLVNEGYPNDGTPGYGNVGYNGTYVNNTQITDGDVVDYYIYGDATGYSDMLTYVDVAPFEKTDASLTVTVKGVSVMNGYLYKDAAELKAAANPLADAKLGWVDPSNGGVTVIDDVATDADGKASVPMPEKDGTYYLATVSNEEKNVYCLMNPEKIVVETPAETTAPVAETTAPAAETTAPAAETTAPAAETTAPAAETTAPAAETIAPPVSTTAAATTTAPATSPAITAPAATKAPVSGGVLSGNAVSGTFKIAKSAKTIVVKAGKSKNVKITVSGAAVSGMTAKSANTKVARVKVTKTGIKVTAPKKAVKGKKTTVTLKNANTKSAKIKVYVQNTAKKIKATRKSVTIKKGKTKNYTVKVTKAENKKKAVTDAVAGKVKVTGKNVKFVKATAKKGKVVVKIKGRKKGTRKVTIKVGSKKIKIRVKVK